MSVVIIAAQNLPNWQRDADVELRLYATESFLDSGGVPVVKGYPSEDESKSDNWFVRVPCTLSGSTLMIAQCQLYSTTDSDNAAARWRAWFYTSEGQRLTAFGEFDGFALPPNPAVDGSGHQIPAQWSWIAQYQRETR